MLLFQIIPALGISNAAAAAATASSVRGAGKEEERQMFQQMQAMAQKQVNKKNIASYNPISARFGVCD